MYYIGSLPVNDAQLQHYGIKGMRWGVIRSPEQLGHRPGEYRESIISKQKKQSPKWVKTEYRNTNPGRRKPMDFSQKRNSINKTNSSKNRDEVMRGVNKKIKASTVAKVAGGLAVALGAAYMAKTIYKQSKEISNLKTWNKTYETLLNRKNAELARAEFYAFGPGNRGNYNPQLDYAVWSAYNKAKSKSALRW